MKQFIYRGESEREFYLVFTKAVAPSSLRYEDDRKEEDPLGVIIVAKDYESSWIGKRQSFMGWSIEFAPVSSQYVMGFDDPHWALLRDHTDASDIKYLIYRSPQGSIIGDTLSTSIEIADSEEAYEKLPLEEMEKALYNAEMNASR